MTSPSSVASSHWGTVGMDGGRLSVPVSTAQARPATAIGSCARKVPTFCASTCGTSPRGRVMSTPTCPLRTRISRPEKCQGSNATCRQAASTA